MVLIISPKTTKKQLELLRETFGDIRKVPKTSARLEFGNFNDNFYKTFVGSIPVHIILTGYGGASVGFAIAQYQRNYLKSDPVQEAYFVGSIFKPERCKHLELGDILYAYDTYGEDEWSKAIYKNAKNEKLSNLTKPSGALVKRLTKIASDKKFNLKRGKVFCRWHPGTLKKFNDVLDLLDKGMWWKFAASQGKFNNHDFDGGEIESAAFTATCNLASIPNVSLFDVRDERVGRRYRLVEPRKKLQAQHRLLRLIQHSTYLGKKRKDSDVQL